MRIRGKLTVLLLVVSIVPLLFAAVIGQVSTRRVGFGLAADTREALVDRARRLLHRMAENDAAMFRRDAETLTTAVLIQAREVARALGSSAPLDAPAPRMASDYDAGLDPPPDYGTHPGYERVLPDGSTEEIPVSFEDQVFYLTPDAEPANVRDQMRRLAGMPAVYNLVRSVDVEAVRWQYSAFETGLHASFPGHGGYPDTYDPRTRPWYVNAVATPDQPVWNDPIVDAATGRVMITVSAAVRDRAGRVVGVTALDLALPDLMQTAEIPEHWGRRSRAFLVDTDVGAAEPGMLPILAEREYEENAPTWDTPLTLRSLRSGDAEGFAGLTENLRAARSGQARMPFDGVDSLWAYASLWPVDARLNNAGVVLVVPYEDIVGEAVAAQSLATQGVYTQLASNIAAFVVVVVVVVLVAVYASRLLTRPIRELADAASRVASGDLDARADVRTRDELHELGEIFNSMVPQLADRMRLRKSIDLAMEVQQNLLPKRPPEIPGLDIAGISDYCDETGGDYYDYLELPSGSLAVVVGDVTGHGVAAALLMTTGRAMLRSRLAQPGELPRQIADVNRALAADSAEGRFMTMFLLVIEPTGLRWISAGHDPAIVYDRAADRFTELAGSDLPLGVDEDRAFRENTRGPLGPDETLVIGTDGIWESRNHAGEMFGKERLRHAIRSSAGGTAGEVCEGVRDASAAFRGLEYQQDDVTLVVVKGRA